MTIRWAVIPRGLDVRDESNWEQIADLVGAADIAVMTAEHGTAIHHATSPGRQAPADILVCDTPGLAVAAVAADCVPVVLDCGTEVVVVHAGWRGVLAGAVALAAHGRAVSNAVIGPSICGQCYEVSEQLIADFQRVQPAAVVAPRHLDLAAAAREQLPDVTVHHDVRCTREDPGLYSYRGGDQHQRGGIVAVLA